MHDLPPAPHLATVHHPNEVAQTQAVATVESLRDKLPQLRIVQHTGGGSFKSQMKKADKSGARLALIWGEDEVASGTVGVKALRLEDRSEEGPGQQSIALADLQDTLRAMLAL